MAARTSTASIHREAVGLLKCENRRCARRHTRSFKQGMESERPRDIRAL